MRLVWLASLLSIIAYGHTHKREDTTVIHMVKTQTQAVTSQAVTLTPAQVAVQSLTQAANNPMVAAARNLGRQMSAVRSQAVTDAGAMLNAGPDAVQAAIMLVHALCASGADRRQLEAITIVEHVAALNEAWRTARALVPAICDEKNADDTAKVQNAAHAALDVQAELYYLARRMPRSVRGADDVTETLRGLAKMLDAVSRAPIMARPRTGDYAEQYKALLQREHDAELRRLKSQGKLPGQDKTRKAVAATVDADK